MRKIRNPQLHSANPGLLFARGVEQLVSDQLYRPSRNDARELQAESRKALPQESRGNIFNLLMRQFSF
jgi:hypothetical protein